MLQLHPNPAVLSRLASGGLEGRALVEILEHLATCGQCVAAFGRAALAGRREPRPAEGPEAHAPSIDRVAQSIRRTLRRLDREAAAAGAGLTHLAALPAAQRRRAVLADPRLRTHALARAALAASERCRADDPAAAEELAELASSVAAELSPRDYGRTTLEDLRSEIWAAIGNVRRIRSDLAGAGVAFEHAHGHAEAGAGDPAEAADLASLSATFLRDSARSDEARDQYDIALALYHELGERHREGRTLIGRAIFERSVGRPAEGLLTLELAAPLLEPGREPRLLEGIRQNRALLLCDLGEPELGLRTLGAPGERPGVGALDRLRSLWLRALLLEKLGRPEAAGTALRTARRGFARIGIPVDVALLDLELARLALSRGEPTHARELAARAFPVFASRRLAPHAVRALDLFRAADGG